MTPDEHLQIWWIELMLERTFRVALMDLEEELMESE